jgi:hypothetical protein
MHGMCVKKWCISVSSYCRHEMVNVTNAVQSTYWHSINPFPTVGATFLKTWLEIMWLARLTVHFNLGELHVIENNVVGKTYSTLQFRGTTCPRSLFFLQYSQNMYVSCIKMWLLCHVLSMGHVFWHSHSQHPIHLSAVLSYLSHQGYWQLETCFQDLKLKICRPFLTPHF